MDSISCCFITAVVVPAQAEHSTLLEEVQQLEVLRKENGEMASLVAQLQVLKGDHQQLQELRSQLDTLQASHASMQRESQALAVLLADDHGLEVRESPAPSCNAASYSQK